MPGQRRMLCCSRRLAGFLPLLCASPVTVVAQSNCSHVAFTGGRYSGIYSTSGDMVNGRHLFTTEDDDGNVVNLAFYSYIGRRRLVLEAPGEGLAEPSHEIDGYRHGGSSSSTEEIGLPRSGLETVRDHAGETLGACSSGYWGTFVYRDDDFGNASAVEFPAYYVFDCSSHPADVNQTWYELDCSNCNGTATPVSISCEETTSDGTTSTSSTSEQEDNDDGDTTTTDESTTMITSDEQDDDEDMTTSGCDDVMFVGGRYSGIYSWARVMNDRPAFMAEDDDGVIIRLAFYYYSDRRRRLEAVGSGEYLEGSPFETGADWTFPHDGIAPMEEEDGEESGSLPGMAQLEAARDNVGVALAACSDGYWLNYVTQYDASGNAVGFDFPYYFALDCAMHPVNITETWNELYNCSECEATETSVTISCDGTTSDGMITTVSSEEDDDESTTATDGMITTVSSEEDDDESTTATDETTATSASEEDNDDLDDEQDASRQGEDGIDGEDDSDDSPFPVGAVIGVAVVAGLLIIGAIVGCWWYVRKRRNSPAAPASAPPRPAAVQGEAVASRAQDPNPLPTSQTSGAPVATVVQGNQAQVPPPPSYTAAVADKI